MSHRSVVENVATYVPDIAAANALGFEYVLGETNSGLYFLATLRNGHADLIPQFLEAAHSL